MLDKRSKQDGVCWAEESRTIAQRPTMSEKDEAQYSPLIHALTFHGFSYLQ